MSDKLSVRKKLGCFALAAVICAAFVTVAIARPTYADCTTGVLPQSWCGDKGIENMLCNPPEADENGDRATVYNIGNNSPEKLMYFIETLEKAIGKTAEKEFSGDTVFEMVLNDALPHTCVEQIKNIRCSDTIVIFDN